MNIQAKFNTATPQDRGASPDGDRATAASQSNPQAVSSRAGIPSADKPTALERSFRDLCEKHGFTAICVGLNLKQSEKYRFDVSVHWDGFSTRGIGCTGEQGATIAEAFASTIARAITERTPPTTATLADEGLPELAT